MVAEFGIREFDKLTTRIHKKFAEAMKYEYLNRNSYIGDTNYGKRKPAKENEHKCSVTSQGLWTCCS